MYERVQQLLDDGEILLVRGKVEKDGDEQQYTKMVALDIDRADIPSVGDGLPIILQFTEDPDYSIIKRIEQIIDDMPGDSPVYLSFCHDENEIKVRFNKPTSLDAEPIIRKLVGIV